MAGENRIRLRDAETIRLDERDHSLALDAREWPTGSLSVTEEQRWAAELDNHRLTRTMRVNSQPLWEAILRFPSAPIYGINRVSVQQLPLGQPAPFHSLRILARRAPRNPPSAIYLFNNGLNELADQPFYYKLASWILEDADDAVCLLRPFPGHLTRFPFQGRFAEKPLARYLIDSADLFRQFLRYMVETRWLISILVPRSQYRTVIGTSLLGQSANPAQSRLAPSTLSEEIEAEWSALLKASLDRSDSSSVPAYPPDGSVLEAVSALRKSLAWNETIQRDGTRPRSDAVIKPALHTVGYSLGGFVAQSIFMAWPFAVSSCTTICSGGALRDLAPTAFAHPEEWQTLLHSLRYELDAAFGDRRLRRINNRTAGLSSPLFDQFLRIFYEIFEQEYRGSYQTRVSEYKRRLLFVVGGNDPIVRTESVLDAAPHEGINLISIAGLSHFVGAARGEPEEQAQKAYWLPQIGKVIASFSREAAHDHARLLNKFWLAENLSDFEDDDSNDGRMQPADVSLSEFGAEGAMPFGTFERQLDWMIGRIANSDGYLFIFRNEIPAFLLDRRSQIYRAAALHHSDERVAEYLRGLRARAKSLLDDPGVARRVTIVLPRNIHDLFLAIESNERAPSRSEASLSELPAWPSPRETWSHFQSDILRRMARGSEASLPMLRFFSPGVLEDEVGTNPEYQHLLRRARRQVHEPGVDKVFVTTLPDAWIWVGSVNSSPFGTLMASDTRETAMSRFLTNFARHAVPDPDGPEAEKHFSDDFPFALRLQSETFKVVSISRAAYNPRFRGTLLRAESRAREIVFHAALALMMSRSVREVEIATPSTRSGPEVRS